MHNEKYENKNCTASPTRETAFFGSFTSLGSVTADCRLRSVARPDRHCYKPFSFLTENVMRRLIDGKEDLWLLEAYPFADRPVNGGGCAAPAMTAEKIAVDGRPKASARKLPPPRRHATAAVACTAPAKPDAPAHRREREMVLGEPSMVRNVRTSELQSWLRDAHAAGDIHIQTPIRLWIQSLKERQEVRQAAHRGATQATIPGIVKVPLCFCQALGVEHGVQIRVHIDKNDHVRRLEDGNLLYPLPEKKS